MRRATLTLVAGGLLLTACTGGTAAPTSDVPPALELLQSGGPRRGQDTFEVWICHVPDTTTDEWYVDGGARVDLQPAAVASLIEQHVPTYFATLSGGAYSPRFVEGGSVGSADGHEDCIERALDASGPAADAVLVVADAEHAADQPGGSAQPGTGCSCPAHIGRRAAYVGASDFDPSWGAVPALDLIEHEIGHTLGLPHSVDATEKDTAGERSYTSALDVMSDSAAPRDVDPFRRDGPATIAADLIALGWVPAASIAVVDEANEFELRAGAASAPPGRVAVVALDEHRLLTVELLMPTGYDDHLPAAGVAVHLVDQSPAVCGHPDAQPCTGIERRQAVLGSTAPHTDLLTTGEVLDAEGWRIEVTALDTTAGHATLALTPTAG